MKFKIITYGCQMNVRDSEAVEALLLADGHTRVDSEEEAELLVVNSCTVRQKAENKALGKTGYLCSRKRDPETPLKMVGIMGCAVQRLGDKVLGSLPGLDFAVGPRQFDRIPALVRGEKADRLHVGPSDVPGGLDAHVVNGFQAFVNVMIGCDNCCSYCIVPKTRGHEYSRPSDDIVREVACLAEQGVKEVTLLGQSVLKYRDPLAKGRPEDDGKESFPLLLRRLNEIPGLERIRFTSAHPKGCTDQLVAAYRDCAKVCRHLHLPVQSGSDRVLAEMGRRYTRAEYLAAVKKLREFDPEFSVTTDVIVGYPGEIEEDFELTRSLMEEAGFDNAFIFKYSPRPGTRSAALPDDVPVEEKERRDQVLLADQERRGLARNQRLVGSVREVMVEGPSKRNADRLSGRDSGNRIVVWDRERMENGEGAVGSLVKIRIVEAHPQILVGEPVAE